MGLIDASKPRSFRPRNGLLAPILDETTSTATVDYGTGEGHHGEKPGGRGLDYGAMTQAEFNQAAQDRANRSFMERHAPGAILGALMPGGGFAMTLGSKMDDANFANEQSKRSAEFVGRGQSMPDEDMMAGYGGIGGTGNSAGGFSGGGVSAADLGASLAEGNTTGVFAKGGKVGRKGLLDIDPPGPDNVVIGAKTGERILNEKQYRALSQEARAEVDRVLKAKRK